MAFDLEPTVAVAVHGKVKQKEKMKQLVEKELPNTTVVIPEPYEPIKLFL